MEARIGALEVAMGRVETRLDGLDAAIGEMKATLRRIEEKALTPADLSRAIHEQTISRWDVAKIVAGVLAFGFAAALAVPRLLGLIPPGWFGS